MQLATVSIHGKTVSALRLPDGSFMNLAAAAEKVSGANGDVLRAGTLQAVIDCGDDVLKAISELEKQASSGELASACHPASEVTLLAPLPQPRKNVFCVGRNYAAHIAEGDKAQNKSVGVTEFPVYFTKPPTTITAPEADIPIFPELSTSIDYEVELTLVIGKAGRNIAAKDAWNHIFGYTIMNDITARDVQRRHGGQYFKGKALDGSCPLGPWIVTADAIKDPHNLSIKLSVNDEERQNGNTRDMIFDIPTLVESLSEGLTLEPGDLIATGTPSGVGYAMDPPRFLKEGDVVVCEVEGVGQLRNTMRNA